MVLNEYAFAAWLGPVGNFIRAGRRSRDLWYGSRYLSEVTKEAASSLLRAHTAGVELILPVPERLKEEVSHSWMRYRGPTISNKLLARVRAATAEDIHRLAEGMLARAREYLGDELSRLLRDPKLVGPPMQIVDLEALQAQISAIKKGDFIELTYAFAPVNGAFEKAVSQALTLLDARKTARVFVDAAFSKDGRRKSNLDHGRDSVLRQPPSRNDAPAIERARRVAGIRSGEELDAIGLARRRAVFSYPTSNLRGLPFPSLARVAADGWLEGARRRQPDVVGRIEHELAQLEEDTLALISSPVREAGRTEATRVFGYDPSILFDGGWRAAREDVLRLKPSPDDPASKASKSLESMRSDIEELHWRLSPPIPYYAYVAADGDGVGQVMSELGESDLKSLAGDLYRFADTAWNIVEAAHGCAFFVGGDELNAYVPLDRILDVASRLTREFRRSLASKYSEKGASSIAQLSLSVGIYVAHVHEDLRGVRRRAEEVLQDAKKLRATENARKSYLAIVDAPRAGSERECAGVTETLVESLKGWMGAIRSSKDRSSEVSLSTAHDLLELRQALGEGNESELLPLARALVRDKWRRSGNEESELPQHVMRAIGAWRSIKDVERTAHEILFAERFIRVAAQRGEAQV
jgi:CRISPR-associated protein Cmr2